MARITGSARRKRRLRAPASARPAQAARRNADSEDFGFVLKGKIPGISGELNLERRGSFPGRRRAVPQEVTPGHLTLDRVTASEMP
jgi:hypothetical protein